MLARVEPLLRARGSLFKTPASLSRVLEINAGFTAFSQVGKVLTLYPSSAQEAVEVARELHGATRGLHGPQVPFDERYRARSLVYYRYGAFRRPGRSNSQPGLIFDPAGKPHRDRCVNGRAVPPWLDDPFRPQRARPRKYGPIGGEYIPVRTIAQRGKGGVYEVVDLSVSPARLVILKEGRRHGETDILGKDGYDRLENEVRVLRMLRSQGLPVPEVFADFSQDGNRYLVLEKIAGRRLLSRKGVQPPRPCWRRAHRILEQAIPLLSRIHAAGWVWRDCKPSHIFMHRGAMRLIDFEGACRVDDRRVLPWSSPHYAPPGYEHRFSRRPGAFEDEYALGVIAFQFATGEFPGPSRRKRRASYHCADCPNPLREQIEGLLQL